MCVGSVWLRRGPAGIPFHTCSHASIARTTPWACQHTSRGPLVVSGRSSSCKAPGEHSKHHVTVCCVELAQTALCLGHATHQGLSLLLPGCGGKVCGGDTLLHWGRGEALHTPSSTIGTTGKQSLSNVGRRLAWKGNRQTTQEAETPLVPHNTCTLLEWKQADSSVG